MNQQKTEVSPPVGATDLYSVFNLCYDDVYKFFGRRGFNPDEIGDLIQETFVEVVKGWSGFRGDAPVEGWVLGVARNVLRGNLRHRTRAKRQAETLPLGELATPPDEGAVDPLGASLAAERSLLLRRAMEDLPPGQKHCLVLRIDQDLSYREISEVLLISVEAAKTRVFQAKRRLRDALSDHFEIDLF